MCVRPALAVLCLVLWFCASAAVAGSPAQADAIRALNARIQASSVSGSPAEIGRIRRELAGLRESAARDVDPALQRKLIAVAALFARLQASADGPAIQSATRIDASAI